jgi:flagellum-specific peptidoglycan hydrolase FlgJ
MWLEILLSISIFNFGKNNDRQLPENEVVVQYIEMYKDLAIIEMKRSGIPASIILAQAILESNCGTSDLSLASNNHFGIKCKSYWVGKTHYHKDDDYNKQGQLVESCFRAYDSVLESYVDHSNFLLTSPHYKGLFKIPISDYASWARALSIYGYATDTKYATKLIELVESQNLNQFDLF